MPASQTDLQIRVALQDAASSGLIKLGGLMAGVFSINLLKNFAEESVRSAATQQLAESKLAAMLGNVKTARMGDFEALKAQASAMQKVTTYGDEEIINAQAMLATDQLRGDQIQQLIPGIMDMASANAALGQTNGDLTATAEAVGKAFEMGAGVLGRQNLVMSEAEKKAFDLADKTGKLNILVKALQDNFGGAAAAAAETYEGRMKRVSNQIDEVKESIGSALIPTIDYLSKTLLDNLLHLNSNTSGVNNLAKAIFQIVNAFIAAGKVVITIIKGLAALGDVLYQLGSIAWNFGKDVVGVFSHIKETAVPIMHGLLDVLKGDFSKAGEEFKKSTSNMFTNTTENLKKISYYNDGWAAEFKDDFKSIGESINEAMTGKGFVPMQAAAQKAYTGMKPPKEITKGAKEVQDALAKLQTSYKDLAEKAGDSLSQLEDDHRDKMKSIRDDIDKTKKSIQNLNDDFYKQKQSDTKSVAEEIIKTEQRVAEIQKELASGVSGTRADELQAELIKNQQALLKNNAFIKSVDGAVTEARRRAALTDLERAIEDYNQRRSLAQSEYNEKLNQLQTELAAVQQKEISEMALYTLQKDKITEMLVEATKDYKKIMDEQFNITKEKIEAEIDLYARLADAIAKVRGGSIGQVSRINPNPGASTQYNNLNLSVNANLGSGTTTPKELANQIADTIMNQLKMNLKLQ